jgi:hypothetical protein
MPRGRELRLEHAERCSFLIMEQNSIPLAVEMISGKHCDFSTYLAKRARAQFGACAKVNFPDYGTVLWYPGRRNCSRKDCDFSIYIAKRARDQSGACAEVQFPDYRTELWSPGSRNGSREAQRFQHISCQESVSSVWSTRRGAVS